MKNIYTIALFVLISFCSFAQGTLTGEGNPSLGNTYTYSFTNSTAFSTVNWSVTSNGFWEVSWFSTDKKTAYVEVIWNTTGAGTVTLKVGTTTIATKNVNAICGTTQTPV